jgi:murein DD-endopeptidase MepM/ murein hydrolase activator NlpD
VYFLNSLGTPVYAAAYGKVVVAGNDSKTNYGYRPGMYGNLVILEHRLPGVGKPVYTLYAHLSEVLVKKDDQVATGEEIGRVGMSGMISGSTLYFEIRHQENLFHSARNPELWLEASMDDEGKFMGALAGRIIDAEGKYVPIKNIVIERLAGPGLPALDQVYLQTYASDFLTGRPPWKENFAVGDLPAGRYQISFWLEG